MKKDFSNFPTLDLHGYHVNEAGEVVESFINDLIELKINGGIIIHGRGTGKLKEVVHNVLKHHANVIEIFNDFFDVGVTYFSLDCEDKTNNLFEKSLFTSAVQKVSEISLIKNISISNLFGCFNYKVNFDNNNVFVIHAPNGCGKSHFLKYIQFILDNKIDNLYEAPFEKFEIETTDNSYVIEPYSNNNQHMPISLPKCNYISDLHSYNFVTKEIINENKYKIFQEIMNEFFCYEKYIIINKNNYQYGIDNIDIIYNNESKYTNPSILKKGDKIEFEDLSSGEKFIIKLFYKLIFDLNNNSFVIIDEPELSLHVEWQELMIRNIVKVAKEFEVYILIVTHSPYIVNNPDVEVGVVEYEEE